MKAHWRRRQNCSSGYQECPLRWRSWSAGSCRSPGTDASGLFLKELGCPGGRVPGGQGPGPGAGWGAVTAADWRGTSAGRGSTARGLGGAVPGPGEDWTRTGTGGRGWWWCRGHVTRPGRLARSLAATGQTWPRPAPGASSCRAAGAESGHWRRGAAGAGSRLVSCWHRAHTVG